MIENEILYDWSIDKMIEITLTKPDDFLKIKETLTRIGIASKKQKVLVQSCHILHKKGKYYIVHFKECFLLDGKQSDMTLEDVARRNKIIALLADWKLCNVVTPTMVGNQAAMSSIKVVSHKERAEWTLISKFRLGKK